MRGPEIAKLLAQLVFLAVIFAVQLFGGAGTVSWPSGWVFLVLFFVFVVALTAWLYVRNPDLLRERMEMGRADQKTWDKVFFGLMFLLFVAWLVLNGVDAVRFGWSQVPLWLQLLGGLALLGSFVLFFATFAANTFLSPMVRVQRERGQTVIDSGPYAYVRHPMYAAFVLFAVGTPLLLGSWLALAACLVLFAMVARRAGLEEQTLRAELEGYDAYMQRVRYRLIPMLW